MCKSYNLLIKLYLRQKSTLVYIVFDLNYNSSLEYGVSAT